MWPSSLYQKKSQLKTLGSERGKKGKKHKSQGKEFLEWMNEMTQWLHTKWEGAKDMRHIM